MAKKKRARRASYRGVSSRGNRLDTPRATRRDVLGRTRNPGVTVLGVDSHEMNHLEFPRSTHQRNESPRYSI